MIPRGAVAQNGFGIARRQTLVAFAIFGAVVVSASRGYAEHPFLIVKKSEYAALRARAAQAPWSSAVEEARDFVNLSYNPTSSVGGRGQIMAQVTGAGALLYVVDPANAGTWRSKIVAMLNNWPAFFEDMKAYIASNSNAWPAVVPPSSAFFNSVVALDVIYDDLSSTERARIEANLDAVAEWFWGRRNGAWATAPTGAAGIWALYRGDMARAQEAARLYRNNLLSTLTPDGVGAFGSEYAQGRYGGSFARVSKYGFMHVAEYTGLDPTYYGEPKLKSFYEWLYTAAFSPSNRNVTFSDSGFAGGFARTYAMPFAAARFSAQAAQMAARRLALAGGTLQMPGDLLSFAIATTPPPPAPAFFPSRVWRDGQAVFWEARDSKDALMGALWNSTSGAEHRHKDANAVYLAGYGEHLLLNSGYAGWGNGAEGFSWSYIHDEARSSNVLIVGNQDHTTVFGDGITEDILTPVLDYASGKADKAVGGGARHQRNFWLVHPQVGVNGYFLVVDEVATAGEASTASVLWHPASASYTEVAAEREYRWSIRLQKSTDTYLTIFLATPPASVSFSDGVLAGWAESFVGKYLSAQYSVEGTLRSLMTVFFPHDATHALAQMTRVTGAAHHGAAIDHGNGVVDYALASSGAQVAEEGSVRFQGLTAVYRLNGGALQFYFVRKGVSFIDGAATPTGFESAAPVSLCLHGPRGRIESPGTTVTFFRPGIATVSIDGVPAAAQAAGQGWITVSVPAGNHEVAFDEGTQNQDAGLDGAVPALDGSLDAAGDEAGLLADGATDSGGASGGRNLDGGCGCAVPSAPGAGGLWLLLTVAWLTGRIFRTRVVRSASSPRNPQPRVVRFASNPRHFRGLP